MNLDARYWNNRYLNNEFGWDLGQVSPPIKLYVDQLKNKDLKILIPGAGNSYEAEYLFNNGFKHVFLLDFAEQAIHNFKSRVPDFPLKNLIVDDFFKHYGQYDIIIEQTFFCAINPELRKNYVDHMYAILKSKGKLVGLLFNDTLNTDKPPFGGFKEEYINLFSNKFSLRTIDVANNSVKPREGRELFIIFEKA
jgi:thiopurine S-methyltransferase